MSLIFKGISNIKLKWSIRILSPEGRLKGGGGLISERKLKKIILEIPLKINDIKKVNTLQFYKRNPFKTEQTKKSKMENFSQKGLCSRHVN